MKIFKLYSLLILGGLLTAGLNSLGAAEIVRRPAVLTDSQLKLIANEVNGYSAFNNLRMICTYHRTNGSDQIKACIE